MLHPTALLAGGRPTSPRPIIRFTPASTIQRGGIFRLAEPEPVFAGLPQWDYHLRLAGESDSSTPAAHYLDLIFLNILLVN